VSLDELAEADPEPLPEPLSEPLPDALPDREPPPAPARLPPPLVPLALRVPLLLVVQPRQVRDMARLTARKVGNTLCFTISRSSMECFLSSYDAPSPRGNNLYSQCPP